MTIAKVQDDHSQGSMPASVRLQRVKHLLHGALLDSFSHVKVLVVFPFHTPSLLQSHLGTASQSLEAFPGPLSAFMYLFPILKPLVTRPCTASPSRRSWSPRSSAGPYGACRASDKPARRLRPARDRAVRSRTSERPNRNHEWARGVAHLGDLGYGWLW